MAAAVVVAAGMTMTPRVAEVAATAGLAAVVAPQDRNSPPSSAAAGERVDLAAVVAPAPATILITEMRDRAALSEEPATLIAVAAVAGLSAALSSMTAVRL